MGKSALLIVLDSVGCGNAPDADQYGDLGANTLGHLFENISGFELPNLASLGLYSLLGKSAPGKLLDYATAHRLTEISKGKDTTTGHWELMDCPVHEAFPTYLSFPDSLVSALEEIAGTKFLGNKVASGTEVLAELGDAHLRTGFPILYTSGDSVLQIAAHEEVFGLERLYELCRKTRELLDRRGIRIGRVIARPFVGGDANSFRRTGNRHDYSLVPAETVMNRLKGRGVDVIGVGKIADIFANSGITESISTQSNAEGMTAIDSLWEKVAERNRFVFANLVDFDSLYGHRRDPEGYARCLAEFDLWLGGFLEKIRQNELLIITADHGNDPYHSGTDHTREQVPCLVFSRDPIGSREWEVFSDVGRAIEDWFD